MEDSFGMAIACQTLLRSLDGGKNAATIQFETMRKLRGHYSNFHHTLPNGTGLSTIADRRGSSTFNGSSTYGYWFRHFMMGCHWRMGDIWIPDRAITLEEILHSYLLLEEDWLKFAGDHDMRLQTALTAMILVGGFSGGLRGEELPKLELGAICKHWDEAIQHTMPHVPLVLVAASRCRMERSCSSYLWPANPLQAFTSVCGFIDYWRHTVPSECTPGQFSALAAKERR
jgi:hypothetical protein